MKKQLLFGMVLTLSAVFGSELLAQAAVSVDPAVYTRRGVTNEMQLTNKWLYSNTLQNYNVAIDLLGAAGSVRGMTVKNGKMLFASRASGNKILVVNGTTGARETPINLASNVFTFMGRNKANTADSTYNAGYPCNDIKIDNAGNVLVANMIVSIAGRYQIWKIDVASGAGTLLIDQADLATLFPTAATTMRFDAFGVWGDVTKNAVILAANASATAMEVYKWVITNGVVAAPILIELDTSTGTGADLAGLAKLGSAPQVYPVDDNYFFVDGSDIFPTLIDKNGNVIDGLKTKYSMQKDSVTGPLKSDNTKTIWTMNQSNNGLAEFQVGDKYFVVMNATGRTGVPPSTFRLFQYKDANKSFGEMNCLWTFPQAGMGGVSNGSLIGLPSVEVSGTKANIYVYTGENGYGMYELETAAPAGFSTPNTSKVAINVIDSRIQLSETVAIVSVFNTTGQKLASAKNVAALGTKLGKGIYMVAITDLNGNSKVQKVAVN